MKQGSLENFSAYEPKKSNNSVSGQIKLKTYMASVLTGLSEAEEEIIFKRQDLIEDVCEINNIKVHVPRKVTHPKKHSHVTPGEVYSSDRKKVLESDFVIVMTDKPSFGVGIEVGLCINALIPVIILSPIDKKVSRMLLGIPIMKYEVEVTPENLEAKFQEAIDILRPVITHNKAHKRKLGQIPVGERIKEMRVIREGELSIDSFAKKVGITAKELKYIEEEPLHLSNPSIIVLIRIADVLDVTLAELVDPYYIEIASNQIVESLLALPLDQIPARNGLVGKGMCDEDYRRHIRRLLQELAGKI